MKVNKRKLVLNIVTAMLLIGVSRINGQ
ncbi:Protein of unknown function [Bacillus toyonensis]|nr:Protein of unknown function [Bacillus toyonensis]